MRLTIPLLATMALTLLVASGLALAMGVGSAAADSSVVGPGESIQKAIKAADPGDTIVIRGVLGAVNLKTGELTGSRVRDVSISGFTIRGFKQKQKPGAATIMIDVWGARNVTVVDNHVVGNSGAGIGISAAGLNNTIR